MTDLCQKMDPYLSQYRAGKWRAPLFCEMVLDDMRRLGERLTVLDIGCGEGFDGSPELQERIAAQAGRYVGIEPDASIDVPPYVTEVHRCALEDAPLEPGSVHLAFAVMVLEHVASPERFFGKLHDALAPGGVFWGFTVDRRHYFSCASRIMELLHLKDRYLRWHLGRRGDAPYHNYPTCYRANSPRQVARHARQFAQCETANFHRIGEEDYYLPWLLRPLGRLADRAIDVLRLPGAILVCRLQK